MNAANAHAHVPIVVLAAGEGLRYGGAKQLADVGGEPMLRRVARTALGTGAPVLVVTGARAPQVETALAGLPLQVARHPGWRDGMGSSLAAGIRRLRRFWPDADGALLCLADQPLLDGAMLAHLLQRHRQAPAHILATDHDGKAGPPVLFPRDCLDTLADWSGTRGAQALLEREAARVETFAFGILPDVDTPADLARVYGLLGSSPSP